MTTFAPAPKPKAALPASRTEIQKVSDKQRAKREKNGERFIVSTIAKTSLLDPHFRTRKSIKKENADRKSRRKGQYAKKLAGYRKSACYKAVELRAQGQCERVTRLHNLDGQKVPMRCPNTRETGYTLTHNHLTYARFGGQELPEDIEVLCDLHNAEYETEKRPWNRGRK